jgi:hypothetical protein
MKRTLTRALQGMVAAAALCGGVANAQQMPPGGAAVLANPQALPPSGSGAAAGPVTSSAPSSGPSWSDRGPLLDLPWSDGDDGFLDRLYAGGDYLLIRPTFSTAIAFVRTNAGATGTGAFEQLNAQELNFDYRSAFRVFCGYQFDNCTALQFTYTNIDNRVDVNGAVDITALGQTIIDPFGNTVKAGESILTHAVVRLNIYDIDLIHTIALGKGNFDINLLAGARIADVDQAYEAQILGVAPSVGDFTQTFTGAGPKLGVGVDWWLCSHRQLALYAKTDMALLLGGLDINTTVNLVGLTGQQSASRTRLIPVFETEVGLAWRPWPALTISAGYLFQAWFDLGTAGGTFGGQFTETHDSNIMSFDGLTVRACLNF